jgi:hypothetical protein
LEYAYLINAVSKKAYEYHMLLAELMPGLIDAVTIASHCIPRVVYIRATRELTQEERDQVAMVLNQT